MGFFSWLFGNKEAPEDPAETLVFGAELKCPECETSSYLFVEYDALDLNDLPEACVKDHRPRVNIIPFVKCGTHETCEYSMSFPDDWVNEIPQKKLSNGEEAITTKSFLMCYKNFARIEPQTSGQDGKFANQVKFIKLMDDTYPGLRALLEDPEGSVYLDDSMYTMALEFLQDRIEKRGEINIFAIDHDGEVDSTYILATLDRLIPYGDVMNPDKRLAALETMISRADMEGYKSERMHFLDANMFAAIKAASDKQKHLVETNGLVRHNEEHRGFYNWLGDSMMTLGNAGMIYCIATRNQRLGEQSDRRQREVERKEAERREAGRRELERIEAELRSKNGGAGKWTSSDPLVGDVATAIDDAIPGMVQDVNKIIRDSSGRIVTDLDIELNDVVIQVKSGGGKGLTTQLENTASATGKITVGYVPDAKPSIIKGAEAKGFQVFTDLDELINYLKGN